MFPIVLGVVFILVIVTMSFIIIMKHLQYVNRFFKSYKHKLPINDQEPLTNGNTENLIPEENHSEQPRHESIIQIHNSQGIRIKDRLVFTVRNI